MDKKSVKEANFSGTSEEDLGLERFRELAAQYATANTTSPEIAHDKLVSLGVVTKSGRLTKSYK